MESRYRDRLRTPQEILDLYRPGNLIVLGTWYVQPHGLMRAMENASSLPDPLYVSTSFATGAAKFFSRHGVRLMTAFLGPSERAARKATGDVAYTPVHYTGATRRMQDNTPPDFFLLRVCIPDELGFVNLSLTCGWEYRAVQWLRRHSPATRVVFEINPKLPRVFGLDEFGGNCLHLDDADFLVEDDTAPLEFATPRPSEMDRRIGSHVASLIDDRATIQLGFGTLPMVIGSLLAGHRELGIHTEMFCDAHVDLVASGAVTNAHKGLYNGFSTATFAAGTDTLFRWVKENREMALLPVEETNSPAVLARMNNLVSINSALNIDLAGQTNSHCLGSETYSGLGGAFEFSFGAQLSQGGKSVVCLPSTTTLKDGTVVSNIVAMHPAGARVTMPEHLIDWIATEYGAARLKWLTHEQRAAALLDLAHPAFRDELGRQAEHKLRLASRYPAPPGHFFRRG